MYSGVMPHSAMQHTKYQKKKKKKSTWVNTEDMLHRIRTGVNVPRAYCL